jgi:hypothetical protein
VLGTGGAARSVVHALAAAGARVTVHGRDLGRAQAVADLAGASAASFRPAPQSWDLLVNTTPVGTTPHTDDSPLPDGPFDGVELLSDPFVLVVAATSPLAGATTIPSIQLIAEQRLIGFRSCRSTKWAESQLRAAGTEPNFVFRSEDNGTVQAMAGAGLGSALVPLLAVDTTDRSIRILPTDLEPRRIALMWHRDRYRSPAAQEFVEIAQAVCTELAADLVGDLPFAVATTRPTATRTTPRTPG